MTNPPEQLFKSELIPDEELPGFGTTLFTILLPMIIMVVKTIAELTLAKDAALLPFIAFVGNPITALMISVICSYFTLGLSKGMKKEDILKITDGCFGPVAGMLLVIGAGGAFNQVLQDSGIGKSIRRRSYKPAHVSYTFSLDYCAYHEICCRFHYCCNGYRGWYNSADYTQFPQS